MAKISCEFDTKEKTLAVTIDGKAVDNVYGVNLAKGYSDESGFYCDVMTLSEDKENDIRTMTRLMASESKDAKEQVATASQQFAGFVEVDNSLKSQIASLFRR